MDGFLAVLTELWLTVKSRRELFSGQEHKAIFSVWLKDTG